MRIINYCKKTILFAGKIYGLSLLVFIPLMVFALIYPKFLSHLDIIVAQYHIFCTFFRWGFLIAVYTLWPLSLRHLGKVRYWPFEYIEYWVKQRTKILFWLLVFELVVCENLLLVIFNYWNYR